VYRATVKKNRDGEHEETEDEATKVACKSDRAASGAPAMRCAVFSQWALRVIQ
jgi:hypothetical protein